MKIDIYQIDLSKDIENVAFMPYNDAKGINKDIYKLVYSCEIDDEDIESLETIFYIFNCDRPRDYVGRSLSVSDLVYVEESSNITDGLYYVDDIGWKKIF